MSDKIFYQQGDVLLEPIGSSDIPKDAKLQAKEVCILAEGEVTGHAHRFTGLDSELMTYQTQLYLNAPEGGVVRHEEHKPVEVPGGLYKIHIVREYDHLDEEARRVAD